MKIEKWHYYFVHFYSGPSVNCLNKGFAFQYYSMCIFLFNCICNFSLIHSLSKTFSLQRKDFYFISFCERRMREKCQKILKRKKIIKVEVSKKLLFKKEENGTGMSILLLFDHEKHNFRGLVITLFIQTQFSQCGNFMIFLSVRFYVKLDLGNLEVQNLPF